MHPAAGDDQRALARQQRRTRPQARRIGLAAGASAGPAREEARGKIAGLGLHILRQASVTGPHSAGIGQTRTAWGRADELLGPGDAVEIARRPGGSSHWR